MALRMNGRRGVVLAAGAVALTATSVAWACTPPAPGSQTTLTGSAIGAGGSSIVAKATGAPVTGKGYQLKFADSQALAFGNGIDTCPHSGMIGGPTVATATGKIPATTGVIPRTASLGNGQVCFALKIDNTRWTAPATYTVVVV